MKAPVPSFLQTDPTPPPPQQELDRPEPLALKSAAPSVEKETKELEADAALEVRCENLNLKF